MSASQYETVAGTEANLDEQHEPRTIERSDREGAHTMMTEIGDGTFVAWTDCARCRATNLTSCTCVDGPQEPAYIANWRVQRFERSFTARQVPPALPELTRTRDRRIDAVLRLLRGQGWKIEAPSTGPGIASAPEPETVEDLAIEDPRRDTPDDGPHHVQGNPDIPDYGVSVDAGLDAALERLRNAKEGKADVGF